jgi:hypothetical protein
MHTKLKTDQHVSCPSTESLELTIDIIDVMGSSKC